MSPCSRNRRKALLKESVVAAYLPKRFIDGDSPVFGPGPSGFFQFVQLQESSVRETLLVEFISDREDIQP
jgi:hypothetical protein